MTAVGPIIPIFYTRRLNSSRRGPQSQALGGEAACHLGLSKSFLDKSRITAVARHF